MKKLLESMDSKKSSMSKDEMMAKIDVLKELMDLAKESRLGEMGEKLQKVTVAAPDKESLKAGLEKAEEIVEGEEIESDEMEDDSEDSIADILKKKKQDEEEV